MKKLLPILIVLLLLGGGGYYLYSTRLAPKAGTQQSGGVFGSIKDALSKSLSLQCNFTNEDGTQVAAYLKAGAVRVDSDNSKSPEQSGSYIMKNNKLYFWQKGAKEGTSMEFTEPSVTPEKTEKVQPTESAGSQNQGDNMLAMLEKFKDKCKPTVVGDDLFTPPSDVKFTDFSKMMPTIPTGQPSEQDIQKMMQQYQQNTSSGQ